MSEPLNHEYLEEAGRCPFCGSDDTEEWNGRATSNGLGSLVEYGCLACGKDFEELYTETRVLSGKMVDGTLHQTEDQDVAAAAAEDAMELLEALETLVSDLEESHQDEIMDDHGGDEPGTCSYCRDLAAAQKLIDGIRGVECEEESQGNEKEGQ